MCLSFQQKKALPIGKGGAILVPNKKAYEGLKRMAWDGRDASKSVKEDLPNIILGWHMNMTPDDAAKGLLLLNQYKNTKINNSQGSWLDYPNLDIS
jgi:dTDP-4-amino-4,6-dideoxygalactose transaminase